MAMKSLRESASGGLMKFFLMGLLAMAVGGLVFMDMGGFYRSGGTGSNNVAKIGNETISIQNFDSKLVRVLNRAGLSRDQAYARGYIGQFLGEQIREKLIQQSAKNLGLNPKQDRAKELIKTLIAPSIANGTDPETALQQLMASQRMSESEFVETLNNSIATEPFINALRNGGIIASPLLTKDIIDYQNEQRDISYVIFKNSEATNTNKATDEQLRSLYEATKETYAQPETRDIQVIEIVFKAPEGMDENEALEEQYALADMIDDLAAGGASAEDISKESGAKLYAVEQLDYFSDQHDQTLVTSAFDLEEGEISPVFETDEGKFIAVSLEEINEKTYKPFEDVEKDLRKRWANDQKTLNNKLQTTEIANNIRAGKTKLSALGKAVKKKTNIKRQSENRAPFDPAAIGALFDAKPGQIVNIPVKNGIALAVVTSSQFPKTQKDDQQSNNIATNIKQSMENESVLLFLESQRKDIDISVNQGLLESVYSTPPHEQ